ncbi:MAG: DUF2064 domain-containing protein [Vicinamibacterales bacterium]
MTARRPAVAMLARAPGAGGKTRLTASLDGLTASALRTAILLDTLEAALSLAWPVHVFVTPAGEVEAVDALAAADPALAPARPRLHVRPQADGDLGARMTAAIAGTLGAGHDVAVLVGSDIPDLPARAVAAAAAAAAQGGGRVLAAGPAEDGGFYLLAAADASAAAAAFAGMTWSHDGVLAGITERAHASGYAVALVDRWHDLDAPADLARLVAAGGPGARRTRAVARAIPRYNSPRD